MALCWAAAGGFLGELFSGAGNVVFDFGKRGLKPDPELNLSNPRARKMPYAPAIAIGTLVSFIGR
jgi:prepilin peptidase CpaA